MGIHQRPITERGVRALKCSSYRFYIKSKVQSNHCGCIGIKPRDTERKYEQCKVKLNWKD